MQFYFCFSCSCPLFTHFLYISYPLFSLLPIPLSPLRNNNERITNFPLSVHPLILVPAPCLLVPASLPFFNCEILSNVVQFLPVSSAFCPLFTQFLYTSRPPWLPPYVPPSSIKLTVVSLNGKITTNKRTANFTAMCRSEFFKHDSPFCDYR